MGNPVFDAAFALELQTLERMVEPSTDPLGYGVDLSCSDDMTADYAEVDPYSKHALAEALFRRLTTPRGSVLDDASYGADVRQWLNRGATRKDMQSYSDQVIGECGKDDRVDSAACGVAFDFATSRLDFAVSVIPKDPRLEPFTFTFAVTSDGTALLESVV